MWTDKLTNTITIYVLKLDFIALNDCAWIIVLSSGGKMLKTITFYENYFDTRNSYPNTTILETMPHLIICSVYSTKKL